MGWVVFSGVVTNICNAKFGRERQESGVGYQILWNWKRLPLVALVILQMFTHLSQQPFQQICPLEGSEGPFFFSNVEFHMAQCGCSLGIWCSWWNAYPAHTQLPVWPPASRKGHRGTYCNPRTLNTQEVVWLHKTQLVILALITLNLKQLFWISMVLSDFSSSTDLPAGLKSLSLICFFCVYNPTSKDPSIK